MIRKAIRYSVIQNILQYYECPETCRAECCRNGRVHIFEDEFRVLTEEDKERTQNIGKDSLVPDLYVINNPCSFLSKSNRCEIYDKRPTVCGMYPFKVNSSGTSLGLQPCPLGFMIIQDLSSWVMDTISKLCIPDDVKSKKLEEWKTTLGSYAREVSEFHIRDTVNEMQIPFDELDMLSMYLFSKHTVKQGK